MTGRRIEIEGIVQGVGFRPWVYRLACEEGVAGTVRNDGRGVTIEAFGSAEALDTFLGRLESSQPSAADVRRISSETLLGPSPDAFQIAASDGNGKLAVSIPADLATCPECLAEVMDTADCRHRYPFTNCTNCGPRFTIVREIPYDRPATTMREFSMCPACQAEYDDPRDRRFHAQPNACPVCGPRLSLTDGAGLEVDSPDPLGLAARALAAGKVVAVKGLGGYHLACDATSPPAVARLRQRKGREAKPFAVMVRDPAAAAALAVLGVEELRLLTAVERPIVLASRRPDSPVADEVAPGLPLLGLMLPYTPLHHLLLDEVGRPLVMTSGNLSDEPITYRNEDAVERLGGIADLILGHDRPIENPCDDSVARVVGGSPVVLRRSRGYVPRPLRLARPVPQPILACGADLKNAFCLAVGSQAYFGAHVGDLETIGSLAALRDAVERMQRFLGVEPRVVAHDFHPRYHSTRYAHGRPEPKIGVQHHHAHVAACLAEHGISGPALGVAFDGTGYGTDGTAWGGELLLVDGGSCQRLATLRPLRLPGGEVAIREPWRQALALVWDAFDGETPEDLLCLRGIEPSRREGVVRMLESRVNTPLAHGAGRYFDAFAALALGAATAHYEGELALRLEMEAWPGRWGSYPFWLRQEVEPWEVDLRPAVRQAVADVRAGGAPGVVAAKFHDTLAVAVEAMASAAARRVGLLPLALAGGCFQNARLTATVVERLGSRFPVLRHRQVPPGDGGVALGQVVVAGAILERAEAGEGGESRCV